MTGHRDTIKEAGNIWLQNGGIQIQQPGGSPARVSVKKE